MIRLRLSGAGEAGGIPPTAAALLPASGVSAGHPATAQASIAANRKVLRFIKGQPGKTLLTRKLIVESPTSVWRVSTYRAASSKSTSMNWWPATGYQ
jgi:hypothetical protein